MVSQRLRVLNSHRTCNYDSAVQNDRWQDVTWKSLTSILAWRGGNFCAPVHSFRETNIAKSDAITHQCENKYLTENYRCFQTVPNFWTGMRGDNETKAIFYVRFLSKLTICLTAVFRFALSSVLSRFSCCNVRTTNFRYRLINIRTGVLLSIGHKTMN